jgi:hypothetical protein
LCVVQRFKENTAGRADVDGCGSLWHDRIGKPGDERQCGAGPSSTPLFPPKTLPTVPFQRDPDFIDHSDALYQIDRRCSRPAGRVTLVGLSAVGKSQLAIEHDYRTRDRSRDQ